MKRYGILFRRSSAASSTGMMETGPPRLDSAPPASIAAKCTQSSSQCVFVFLSCAKLIFKVCTLYNQPPLVKRGFRSHWKSSSHPPLIPRLSRNRDTFFFSLPL